MYYIKLYYIILYWLKSVAFLTLVHMNGCINSFINTGMAKAVILTILKFCNVITRNLAVAVILSVCIIHGYFFPLSTVFRNSDINNCPS